MASLSSSHRDKGFTLIEIMTVMAFIAIVGAFTMLVSMDSYRGYNFHSERDLLIAALQHARAQAIGNVCNGSGCTTGKPHGVHIEADKFVVFQGASYHDTPEDAALDSVIPANTVVGHGAGCTPSCDFIFTQLSGNVAAPGTIVLSSEGRTSTITIGAQGQIFWDN